MKTKLLQIDILQNLCDDCKYLYLICIIKVINISCYFTTSEIYFKDLSTKKEMPIREVKASSIGRLISVRGIVMRCTEVKPMISVATYSCDLCGGETYQTVII